jgi:HAD superfamily hydrolase (TIGR01509 family)
MIARAILHLKQPPASPALVIFDCDGVLIDSEVLCNRVVAEDLTAQGWPMSVEESHNLFIGLTFPDTQRAAEAHLGRSLGKNWVAGIITRVTAIMAAQARPIPGARAALEGTTALGLRWRVASNSSHQEMAAKFAAAGLADLVGGRVHSAYDVITRGGAGKPAPDVFLEAATSEGVSPAACLVIEDSVAGIRGALAAGMTCLGFSPDGHNAAELAAAGAIPFDSMFDVPDLLRAAMEVKR